MKLNLASAPGAHLFNACAGDHVLINQVRHDTSLIVTRDRLIAPWRPLDFAAIIAADLEPILELGCDIVLLGTGPRQHFLHPGVARALSAAGIGLESMNTAAACRTYNILVSEDRKVAAAIVLA